MMKTKELKINGWRVWAVFGQNRPWLMAERSKCGLCYLLHVPYVSVAIVNWDAL